jgi:hypothetical protein
MNRRGFFGFLLGGGAAMALDPERALWKPGAKLISIPSIPGSVSIPQFRFFAVDPGMLEVERRYIEPALADLGNSVDMEIARIAGLARDICRAYPGRWGVERRN